MARTIPSRTRPMQARRSPGDGEAPLVAKAAPLHAPDGLLLFALVGLLSVGMIMVYSASAAEPTISVVSRMRWFGIGFPFLLIGMFLPPRTWRRLMPFALIACAIALASLLWDGNPLAITRNNATRWLGFAGQTVQPSEFTKLAFILFAAHFLERRGTKMGLFKGYQFWVPFLAVLGGLAVMIYKEPDLGTALVLGGTAFCLMLAAGVDWKALVVGVVMAGLLVGFAATRMEHQRERLQSWLNPWAFHQEGGHQVIQSWKAIARGGLWGVGLGQSLQKLDDRLPEAETDFIFAIVAEEMGLVRAVGVVLLYLLFTWRGYTVAARAPDRYTYLLAVGVTSWMAVQASMNLGVVTGTIPNTGVPLPFISSGGSSLLALMLAMGLLLGVSRRTLPDTKEAKEAKV